MRCPSFSRFNARRGAVAAQMTLSMSVLLAVAALALDYGILLLERRQAQASADAASLAAATELYNSYGTNSGVDPGPDHPAATNGRAVADANGYTNDTTNSVVTINIPPTSGTFQGQAGYAEAIIEARKHRYFSSIWGSDRLPVSARAVARGRWPEYRDGILLLHPSKDKSLQISGNGEITVEGAILVNSNHSTAFQISGNGRVVSSALRITGDYKKSGNASLTPTPTTGVAPTPDPMANLPAPYPPDYPLIPGSHSFSGNSNVTLNPGRYQGGISISGNATVVMNPGIYIMEGGGFHISGNGNLTAPTVLIYNTKRLSSYPNGSVQQDADQISISGNGRITWTPPTTGTYTGISIFQDRAVADKSLKISGNGFMALSGLIYAPAAEVQLSGNGTTTTEQLGGAYIASSMQISGNGTVNVTFAGGTRPRVPERPSLVE